MDSSVAITVLSALAQEHRLAIFRLLVKAGPSGLSAGEIAEEVGISPTCLSFHMRELDHAGLLNSWRDGRYVRSAVKVEGMRALLRFLTEDCCNGQPELCGGLLEEATEFCDEC